MMRILLFSILFIAIESSGQQFLAPLSNPFGLVPLDSPLANLQLLFADMDKDGDLDAIHSGNNLDDGSPVLSFQENMGNRENPSFGPHTLIQIDLSLHPVIFFASMADLTADSLPDIMAFGSFDLNQGWTLVFYENTSTDSGISFNGFLADSIGLPGLGAGFFIPALVDLNQDGDVDVLLGGASDVDSLAVLYYGQNKNADYPQYTGWFENPYNFSIANRQTALFNYALAGDLDGDQDQDILSWIVYSLDSFQVFLHQNIAPLGSRPDFGSTPTILDLDLVDSLIGFPSLTNLDNDADEDIILYIPETDEILYFENGSCAPSLTTMEDTVCGGDSIWFDDVWLVSSGVYHDTVMNRMGCDSLITLFLTVLPRIMSSLDVSICEGETHMVGTSVYTSSGSFSDTLVGITGCDSIVHLNLVVLPAITNTIEATICEGEDYTVGTSSYNASGSFTDILTGRDGCDSVVNLNLIVLSAITSTIEATICEGESYTVGTSTYTTTGEYTDVLTGINGCDSIIQLRLSLIQIDTGVVDSTGNLYAKENNATYQWINCDNNQPIEGANQQIYTYSNSGNYAVHITKKGCTAQSACISIQSTSTENKNTVGFMVYPNPGSRWIHIYNPQNRLLDQYILVSNIFGQKQSLPVLQSGRVNISNLQTGFYVVAIRMDNQPYFSTLLVAR